MRPSTVVALFVCVCVCVAVVGVAGQAPPQCQQAWLDLDYQLMTTTDSKWWTVKTAGDIKIEARKTDSSSNLFRWVTSLNSPAPRVFDVFINHINDYSQNWTPEFKGGRVIQQIDENTMVVYQQFKSPVPIASPRDLCYICCTRTLPNGVFQATYRSANHLCPSADGYIRVDWWGANLFTPLPNGQSSLVLIDQEIQHGWMPGWLMNLTSKLPGIFIFDSSLMWSHCHAISVSKFLIDEVKDLRNFFSHGGPNY